MLASLSDGLRKLAIALVHLWYWQKCDDFQYCCFYIYPERDLETKALPGNRIKVTIEIEDWRNPLSDEEILAAKKRLEDRHG